MDEDEKNERIKDYSVYWSSYMYKLFNTGFSESKLSFCLRTEMLTEHGKT